MTKQNKIAALQKKIDEANHSVNKARQVVISNSSLENIREYNNRLSDLGILKIEMKFLCKTTPPEQYLENATIIL